MVREVSIDLLVQLADDQAAQYSETSDGDYLKEGFKLLAEAMGYTSNSAKALGSRGHMHYLAGNEEDAFNDLSAAIKRESNNPDHYINRAQYFIETELLNAAITDLNNAIRLERTPMAFVYLGNAFEKLARKKVGREGLNYRRNAEDEYVTAINLVLDTPMEKRKENDRKAAVRAQVGLENMKCGFYSDPDIDTFRENLQN